MTALTAGTRNCLTADAWTSARSCFTTQTALALCLTTVLAGTLAGFLLAGSTATRADLSWLLANLAAGTVLLGVTAELAAGAGVLVEVTDPAAGALSVGVQQQLVRAVPADAHTILFNVLFTSLAECSWWRHHSESF